MRKAITERTAYRLSLVEKDMLKAVPLASMPKNSAALSSISISSVHPVTGVPILPGYSVVKMRGNDAPVFVEDSATIAELKSHFSSRSNVQDEAMSAKLPR